MSATAPTALRRLASVLAPVAITTALADLLFWHAASFGVSVGIFFAGLALFLLVSHSAQLRRRTVLIVAALLACCVQAGIEVSLSNVLASSALLLALAGEVFHVQLASLWARISEVLYGLGSSQVRWFGLGATAVRSVGELQKPGLGFIALTMRALWVLAPAVILLVVFGAVFAAGNAVFAELISRVVLQVVEWIARLDLSIEHVVFWACVSTLALGLFHGTRAPESPRWWTGTVPRLPRPDQRLALWQSGATLLALNALFCMVNTIDAVYLWHSRHIPAGVNPTQFVHEGVWSLIAAVVLSAVVIAGLFQQDERVSSARILKNLATVWIVQNFVLIAGVFQRLRLYVESSQLTEKRIYVGCFLLLVSTGFILLAIFVWKKRTLNWLLGRNAVATFSLFFVLQFTDVVRVVARYNFAIWQAGGRESDTAYLATLGPSAWSTLRDIAALPPEKGPLPAQARWHLARLADVELTPHAEDWRAWQARRAWSREVLKAFGP